MGLRQSCKPNERVPRYCGCRARRLRLGASQVRATLIFKIGCGLGVPSEIFSTSPIEDDFSRVGCSQLGGRWMGYSKRMALRSGLGANSASVRTSGGFRKLLRCRGISVISNLRYAVLLPYGHLAAEIGLPAHPSTTSKAANWSRLQHFRFSPQDRT